MIGIKATVFKRPNGDREEISMTKISQEDADYINEHRVAISMEDCGAFFTLWADDGRKLEDDDSTPDELTYIVPRGETCEVAMSKVVEKLRLRVRP